MYAIPWAQLSQPTPADRLQEFVSADRRRAGTLPSDRACQSPPADLLRLGTRQLRDLLEQFTQVSRRSRTTQPPLEPSVLVNEVARRLLGTGGLQDLPGREDFIAHLANSFRRSLLPPTAGGVAGRFRVSLAPCGMARAAGNRAVASALHKLEKDRALASQIVILRWFGGLNTTEIAGQLFREQGSIATQWMVAKRWLSENLPRSA